MTTAPPLAPSSSPFNLRWRLFGIRFCVTPTFWIMSALMGWLALQSGMSRGKSFWICLLIWVLCTLVSVLVHELGHVLMGRLFGQPGDITLAGLGGQAAGKYEELKSWQRILVAAAGPGAGFLFLGAQALLDSSHWNLVMGELVEKTRLRFLLDWQIRIFLIDWINPSWRQGDTYFRDAMFYLLLMNLIWNLLNLLPIFPMDGGMILREICCIVSPRGGPKFAFGFSFLVAGLVVVYCLLAMTVRKDLPTIVHPLMSVIMFGMLAVQNFMLLYQETMAQRSAHYRDHFDD